ncbi:carbohydrate ABC transporter permease [Ruficoccus amylovorans]|uniref:Carbohydrate ABC transporter permease n=2 Tax=Ruficoccus amylovorans TaxID=1804625 RepID=A0A842HAT5_9BACT|nr:carbohydrate ABC transporter permease [Ruficoccus amylovorans]
MGTWLAWIVLAGLAVTMLYPLLWMLGTSVKTTDPSLIAIEGPSSSVFPAEPGVVKNLFPRVWHWENYLEVFRQVPFARYFFNSLFVSLAVTIGQVVTSSMAAYAFSRLQFRGRDVLFFFYLATLMVPATVTLIPTFILLSGIGLIDTYFALIVPSIFTAYGTFMLRQFFLGLPTELEEAAILDGCGPVRIYFKIVLPLSGPALAALGIFSFLGTWQNLLGPLVKINRDALKPLSLGLLDFMDSYSANWPLLMAASLLSILPVVFIFLFGQKFFVAGVRLGGVKG